MVDKIGANLSRRERQIMDYLYAHGPSTVADVQNGIPEPPSYSAVRATLGILVEKEILRYTVEGRHYLYQPTKSHNKAKRSAIKHLLATFFDDSTEQAVSAMLDISSTKLSDQELKRLEQHIQDVKRKRGLS